MGKVLRIESKDPKWEKLSWLFSDEAIDDQKTKAKLDSCFKAILSVCISIQKLSELRLGRQGIS
jgi:hypothetical protein